MEKQILLPESLKREIRQTFKVSTRMLYSALSYESDSPKSRILRAAAIERGGMIFTGLTAPEGHVPDVETTYDHVRGVIRQDFRCRLAIEYNRHTCVATILLDNDPIATTPEMNLGSWAQILYSLQLMYNRLVESSNK